MVLARVTIISCKGVTIKTVHSMPATPKYFITLAAPLAGIFFENAIKNTVKLAERKIIPVSAQILDGLSAPFTAFAPNRLLIKFFDQLKPMESLSDKEPPG